MNPKLAADQKQEGTIDAVECLAVMFSHVPGKEEYTVVLKLLTASAKLPLLRTPAY